MFTILVDVITFEHIPGLKNRRVAIKSLGPNPQTVSHRVHLILITVLSGRWVVLTDLWGVRTLLQTCIKWFLHH